jgi:NAD(P)-dependent dehydrogenase (short-subunit alcohol dehydrogenase family)
MKKDTEVKLLMQERRKGTAQRLAAARAGMSERTARKYEQAGQLPSQFKRPHTWATRTNPFEQDWPWVIAQLERDPALQGSTLFALLCEQHPSRYRPTQIRTLQRHIARWRAVHGPEQEVIFEQRHQPGERAQSDFTHMEDLAVTIAGEPFPHMVYHFVLTYSNAEAVSICFSETFEALAEGIETFWDQLGSELPDTLINNAGSYPLRDYLQVDAGFLEQVLRLNLEAAFWMCQRFIAGRKEQGGVIVNVSSIEALVPLRDDLIPYSVSKAGIVALTRTLAHAYCSQGFRVNVLLPGAIRTPGTERLRKAAVRHLNVDLLKTGYDFGQRLALGRWGEADEVACVALFLASDLASYVQGAAIPVDGGFLSS